ncbi:cytochrome c-550 PedF [Nevskia sp.]|uniref:cytochrome c-550 PedF n=1 Tax=Nevskia sp. TaxID=1929292 RepID=UPI0025EDE84E|nr:cytochrome c-550 PedF [Nevskia sp.]
MNRTRFNLAVAASIAGFVGVVSLSFVSSEARAHGDVIPQAVDVSKLPPLKESTNKNPYAGNAEAIKIGTSAYGQNCARCHGLGAVSGGIAPDLRLLPTDAATDEYFKGKVMSGAIRNGVTYMPSFKDVFKEEAIWAIRSYIVSVHSDE